MGHHLAWILAGQTDQRRRGVRNFDCEGWWRAIHSVSHQTISEDWSLNTSMCRQCRCGFSIWLYVVAQPRSVFLEHHCASGRRSPAAQQPSKLHEQTALHKGLVEGCLPVFASQAETNGWGIEITKGLPLELKQRSQKLLVCLVLLVFVSSSWSSLCKSN